MIAWLKKHKAALGNLALVGVMLLGLAYISFGALGWRPWKDTYEVTVHFPLSGGLQDTSKVTLRGAQIGEVRSITVRPKGVDVVVRLDEDVKINKSAKVSALGLSAAGEQYVDFSPTSTDWPYLGDGDTIDAIEQTHVTVPFSDLLESALDLIGQVDAQKLTATLQEFTVALNDNGPNHLRSILQSAGTIFTALHKSLPATNQLISDAGTILSTTSNIQPDLGRLVNGVSRLADSAAAADSELRELLGKGPGRITSLTGSISDISDPMTDALGQLLDVVRQGALRAPTLVNLLPSVRDGAIQSQAMFHDGAWWALASLYPRPYCNYPVTTERPTKILELTIPTNLYCVTNDPNQQRRGSANAPRPAGDDTAGPPADYDPNSRTVPLDK